MTALLAGIITFGLGIATTSLGTLIYVAVQAHLDALDKWES